MNLEQVAKRFARSRIQPLIPARFYAELVRLYYKAFGRRSIQESEWTVFQDDPRLDPTLKQMMLAHEKVPSAERSSVYWKILNNKNLRQLLESGFENFKQTIALNYFTFTLERNNLQEKFLRAHLPPETVERARKRAAQGRPHPFLGEERSRHFNFMTRLLWEFTKRSVGDLELEALFEPSLGNPPSIELRRKTRAKKSYVAPEPSKASMASTSLLTARWSAMTSLPGRCRECPAS